VGTAVENPVGTAVKNPCGNGREELPVKNPREEPVLVGERVRVRVAQ
jgi:hypothetical protein